MALAPRIPRRLTALCLGGAATLEADKHSALSLFDPDIIIACNHAGRDEAGRVDHWVTMHPELFPAWTAARAAAGRPAPGRLWRPRHRKCALDAGVLESWGGSSGLLCVQVGLELECTHIVLAGIPMHQNACHYDDKRKWREARQYWPGWERHRPDMIDRVRSVSGWTLQLLGPPTKEWLDGDG